ncbi:MAG: hypothetical protein ACJAYC_001371 [Halieaceae bacterium]|jgi:hypothetical protein
MLNQPSPIDLTPNLYHPECTPAWLFADVLEVIFRKDPEFRNTEWVGPPNIHWF